LTTFKSQIANLTIFVTSLWVTNTNCSANMSVL